MPELPEVETVRQTLAPALEGRTISAVSFCWPRTCVGDARETEAGLAGQRIERLERHGKYLLLRLRKDGRGSLLVIHLRMTGNLLLNGAPGEYTRATMALDGGTRLVFQDIRKFGRWQWSEGLPARLAALGPDPLEIGPDAFAARLASRKARLKALLLDQQFLRGLGNIYADEALFRARLHPLRQRRQSRPAQGARPARGHPGRAAGRHRRRRLQHPGLPRRPRCAGRLPAADSGLRQGRRAVRDLRDPRAAPPRGATEHPLLPPCGDRIPSDEACRRVAGGELAPRCTLCGGLLKPATVSFGQAMPHDVMVRAYAAAEACDLLLAVGSSLVVEPAASIPRIARRAGARLIIVNRDDPLPLDVGTRQTCNVIRRVMHGEIGDTLPCTRIAASMPELPEVETVRQTLAPALEGRTISAVSFCWPRTCVGDARETEAGLAGQRIERLERHGKYLLLRLRKDGRGSLLVIHLRMTGNLLLNGAPGEYTRATMALDGGTRLVFQDIRKFGRWQWSEGLPARLAALGPDPLEIGPDAFAARLASRKARLKALLLDQQFLRGLGNIYADEALFRARLHPLRQRPSASARARAARPARSHPGRAAGRHRRRRLQHPGLPRRQRCAGCAGRLPAPDPGLRQGRRAVRDLCGTRVRRLLVAQRSTHFCPRCQRR